MPSSDEAPIHGFEHSNHRYAAQELAVLRAHLARMAHAVRMKTLGASHDMQDTARMLTREVRHFNEQVVQADPASHESLKRTGAQLQWRLQKLANQVALSIN